MRNPETKIYVTKAEAARRMGVHRPTLDRLLGRPGAPSPDARKRYDFAALSAFVAGQKGAGALDNLRDARLREVQLRCERLQRELDRDAKNSVLMADVDQLLVTMAAKIRSYLYSKLENELPQKIAGCDALTIRKYGRSLADEICNNWAQELDRWKTE